MRRTLLLLLTLLVTAAGPAGAQALYFPPRLGSAWETTAPAALGYRQARIDSLYQFLEQSHSKAFILLKDGRIVLERYFGTFTQDSAWQWASAGKTLTAVAVGLARQEGSLSLDSATDRYLGTGWTAALPAKEALITVRNQLTMTAGLNDTIFSCTRPACLRYLADAGTRWAYHNGPYTLLDSVIERATGQSLNPFLTPRLLTPTGMTGRFFQAQQFDHVFFSKARSMARFGTFILAKGSWAGTPILTDTAYFRQMLTPSQALNPSYGYLWWLNGQASFRLPASQDVYPGPLFPSAPGDAVSALGSGGQILSIAPSQSLHWVRMGNEPNDQAAGLVTANYTNDIWRYLSLLMQDIAALRSVLAPALRVHPNPAANTLYVDGPALRGGAIYNHLGVEVMALEGNSADISRLPPGMYILHAPGHSPTRFTKA